MSEITDKVKTELDTIILRAIEQYMGDWDEAIEEAKAKILNIEGIAMVDRKAELPFPMITIRTNDPRYQDGAMQQGMRLLLEAGWVKESKEC